MNTLVEGQVDVWLESLSVDAETLQDLYGVLTPAERERCDRCQVPLVRSQRIVARGKLRQLLASYLNVAPESVDLTVGLQGKPQVAGLEFNLSHSGDLVAYGIGSVAVGIDIEQQRDLDCEALMQRFFAPAEQRAWQQVPVAARSATFFQLWTMKEAYVKAIGTGLHTPLSTFAVSLQSPWQILGHDHWQVEALSLPEGYWGAIAIHKPGSLIQVNKKNLRL
jgi:4'-phosphopantetheinyl transferase